MNPAVQGFLDKFTQDAEDLIRNVAAFNQLAHIQNHSYKQSTHPCHQKFPRRPEPPPLPRQIPKKKVESSPQGTQTCLCLYKQLKSTNTEKTRKSSKVNSDDYQNNRSNSQEQRHSSIHKRPCSMQSEKRCFTEALPLKSLSSSNKKRGCCQINELCDDVSSTNSQKSDKCVCRANHGAPVDIQDTPMELEEFTEKFSDAQRSLQILKNRIADLNYYMNESEPPNAGQDSHKSKMKMNQRSSTMCPPCPPPSSASRAGYGVPDLPQHTFPEIPPLKIKKLIPRSKFEEQGGTENNFSFGNMPVMPPHTVPVLPGTFVSLGRSICTPRGSRRSNPRVSFND